MPKKQNPKTRKAGPRLKRGENNTIHTAPGSLISGRGAMASLTKNCESWMPIFPARTKKVLRYSSFALLTTTSGAVATYVLRANDLFDPDFTGTGHQPMGFDQMMLSYNHFIVTKARLVCTFRNTGGSNCPAICLRQDANSTPLTVSDRIIEFGGAELDVLDTKNVNGCNKTLSLDLNVTKLQGIRSFETAIADPTLRGDAATSPTEVTYFHIQSWDSNAATGSCLIDFVLEQEAVFMEPRDLIESLQKSEEKTQPPHTTIFKNGVEVCLSGTHRADFPCSCNRLRR
jgi:hypothetical protein